MPLAESGPDYLKFPTILSGLPTEELLHLDILTKLQGPLNTDKLESPSTAIAGHGHKQRSRIGLEHLATLLR